MPHRINETVTDVFVNVNNNEMFFTWRGEQYTAIITSVYHEEAASWRRRDGVRVHVPESYMFTVLFDSDEAFGGKTFGDIVQIGEDYKIMYIWEGF